MIVIYYSLYLLRFSALPVAYYLNKKRATDKVALLIFSKYQKLKE
jgi:hypothetical protein